MTIPAHEKEKRQISKVITAIFDSCTENDEQGLLFNKKKAIRIVTDFIFMERRIGKNEISNFQTKN